MENILITNRYSEKPFEILQSLIPTGFQLIQLEEVTQEDLIKKCSMTDYILASGRLRVDKAVLEAAAKLKMIQRTGVGLDALDLPEIWKRNISVYVNRGVNADSVAEHALMLMLACLRRLPIVVNEVKSGIWKKQLQGIKTKTLKGKTVGIIGMGSIGRRLAELLGPFGVTILYYDPQIREVEASLNAEYVDKLELFERADIISLNCALNGYTKEMICAETLSKMRDGVILVNTARGGLIRESDLVGALASGKVAFAALDVFAQEPPLNMELLALKNVITTPHIAGVTYDSFYQMMHDAVRNIVLFHEKRFQEIEPYRLKPGGIM